MYRTATIYIDVQINFFVGLDEMSTPLESRYQVDISQDYDEGDYENAPSEDEVQIHFDQPESMSDEMADRITDAARTYVKNKSVNWD